MQEFIDPCRGVLAAAKQEEVTVRAQPQFAVGHDAVVFQGCCSRH